MSEFSRDWLKLRESADLAARDPALARRFGAALRRRPDQPVRLLDLGAGSGANCRALLPRVGGDQEWLLIDRDRALLAAQEEEFSLWARRQGYPILAGGGRMTITAGSARWSVTSVPLDLAREQAALDTFDADGVTAASLFDLVSATWLDGFVSFLLRRHLPLLAVLTLDGRRDWVPSLPQDEIVARGFRRHQVGDKGFGPALGGEASVRLAEDLRCQGFEIAQAPSDWRLGTRDRPLLAELVAGEAQAARETEPENGPDIAQWEKQRRNQLQSDTLKLAIGHRDLLALPG